jgi:prepilin-type processing-associated H-X9-DG protein
MKTIRFPSRRARKAFTVTDLIVVLVTVVLAIVFLVLCEPWRWGRRRVGHRPVCVNNLKQIGIAARMWAADHQDRYPWQTPPEEGGTKELTSAADVYRHFLVMSNYLNTPRILYCPHDSARTRTNSFGAGFTNVHLSYLVGLDSDETRPNTILASDRHLSTNQQLISGLLLLTSNSTVGWVPGMHNSGGNVGLADGSVRQYTPEHLQKHINDYVQEPQRLLIP